MSARTPLRAVLVFPRVPPRPKYGAPDVMPVDMAQILDMALDEIASAGYELVGVIDTADHLVAHQMLLDGRIDIIVASRPDHLASVRIVSESAWYQARGAVPPVSKRRSALVDRSTQDRSLATVARTSTVPQDATRRRPVPVERPSEDIRQRRTQPLPRPEVA